MTTAERLLNRQQVEELTGYSCSSLYRKIREGSFPLPLKTGARAVRWRQSDINQWQADLELATGDAKKEPAQR